MNCVFTIWLSKSITVSLEPLQSNKLVPHPLLRSLRISLGTLSSLLARWLFIDRFLERATLQMLALIQIAYVIFQELNEIITILANLLQICGC